MTSPYQEREYQLCRLSDKQRGYADVCKTLRRDDLAAAFTLCAHMADIVSKGGTLDELLEQELVLSLRIFGNGGKDG